MIKKEEVEELHQRFMTDKGLSEGAETFRVSEPYVYSWMSTHAKSLVAAISKKKSVDQAVMTDVYEGICRSYMFTYFLMNRGKDMLIEKVMSSDMFQSFLDGNLDERYYRYDTSGMPEDSSLVTAKNNFMRNMLQNVRKRLLPLLAEDVGMGLASQEALENLGGKDGEA